MGGNDIFYRSSRISFNPTSHLKFENCKNCSEATKLENEINF